MRTARTTAEAHASISANIAPGLYGLSSHVTVPQLPGSAAPREALSASTDVDVAGEDVRDVTLLLGDAITGLRHVSLRGRWAPHPT